MKELLPVVEVSDTHYAEAKTAADVDAILNALPAGGALSVAVEAESSVVEEDEAEEEESGSGMLPLTWEPLPVERPRDIAISSKHGVAVTISAAAQEATSKLKSALADANVPKAIHDYKSATHVFERQGITLRGVQHDPMLYSYLLGPCAVAVRVVGLKGDVVDPDAVERP